MWRNITCCFLGALFLGVAIFITVNWAEVKEAYSNSGEYSNFLIAITIPAITAVCFAVPRAISIAEKADIRTKQINKLIELESEAKGEHKENAPPKKEEQISPKD